MLSQAILSDSDKERVSERIRHARSAWSTYAPLLDWFRVGLDQVQAVAPTEVPDGIPAPPEVEELDYAAMIDAIDTYETDLVGLVSRADDFGPTDGSMTLARRLAGPLIIRAAGETYYAGEVERMAVPYADNPHPRYPPILLGGRVEGDVIVQFVVDSTGSADPKSLKIMRSTHELFTRAVKSVLPKLRFLPAEVAGNKVRVLVEQPFRFSVR